MTRPPEIGALERDGARWSLRLSDGEGGSMRVAYPDEESARRARALMLEALRGAGGAPLPSRAAATPATSATPPRRLRALTHALLEEGSLDSLAGRLIEGFLVLLIVSNVAAVALESIPSINTAFRAQFSMFERFSLAVFSIEYFLRVWCCVEDPRIAARGAVMGRVAFVLQPLVIVDLFAFAPSVLGLFFGFDLRVLRVFRLFRLLKLARYSQALQALLNVLFVERSALLASAILLLAVTCLSGEIMHLAEGGVQPDKFGTMPQGMYWALTTLTTVGYGDVTPVTPLGKFIAGCTMILGLASFALPVGIIANGFVTGLSRRRFAITWNMLRRQPLFHDLDVDALTDILEVPTASIVREHAHLVTEGKDADSFYLVVSGSARVEMRDGERVLGPGDMVGVEAIEPFAKYACTVIALEDTRVMAFPPEELRRLCRKIPQMRQRVDAERARDGVPAKAADGDLSTDDLVRLRDALDAILDRR